MKSLLLTAAFTVVFGFALNAQGTSLSDIVEKPSKEGFRATVKADQYGGSISFNRTYRSSSCVGSYYITWRFSKDISRLENGETFNVTLNCVNCKTPCGYKWGLANVFAANNVLSVPNFSNYKYNGNISLVSSSASSSGVNDWNPGQRTNTYTFKYSKKKNVPITAFRFTFAGHDVYYVFEEGATSGGSANCHALLGLGKLVYGLEIGAYEGYGWDWMDKTIGYALNHINASNCLSGSYLKDLKRRMYRAPNTNVFLDEIRSYSQKLETEAAACNCCSN